MMCHELLCVVFYRFPEINHAMYDFWVRFSLLTGSFSLFYNAMAELLPVTVKKLVITTNGKITFILCKLIFSE
jgi:hypothetical protein